MSAATSSNSSGSGSLSIIPLSASAKAALEQKGYLEASVLSVYDLPYVDDVPKAVTLSACGMTVSSGPPLAKQKDRNNFRFAPASDNNSNSNSSNQASQEPTKLVAPLRHLHQETLVIRVVYSDPKNSLQAELPLRELKVHEQKWLELKLSLPEEKGATASADEEGSASGETAIQVKPTRKTTSQVTEEEVSHPPTIRIKFRLSGPYRPEVAAAVKIATSWFRFIDKVEGGIFGSSLVKFLSSIKSDRFNKNFLLIPLVPLLTVLVAAFPVVAGFLVVAVPFLLPLALVCVGLLATGLLSWGLVYYSTKTGRLRVGTALGPLVETYVASDQGQALIYDTGPRPTPVSVCRQVMPTTIWSKLWVSLLIDLIGSSSYLLPVVGEAVDLAWAPTQTIFIMALYDATSPNLKYMSFLEEALPFTDVVPSASIGWAFEFLPILAGDFASKNKIPVDPGVTSAVSQLVTKAAVKVQNKKNI